MSLTLEESRLHKAYVNLENLARHPADMPAWAYFGGHELVNV